MKIEDTRSAFLIVGLFFYISGIAFGIGIGWIIWS